MMFFDKDGIEIADKEKKLPKNWVLNLEKKWEKEREKGKHGWQVMPCLNCGVGAVIHWEYNLCRKCREDFGHNYFREL